MSIDTRDTNYYSIINESSNAEKEKLLFMEHVGTSNFTVTCINLLKSILGTGLLALPFTFKVLGPLLAVPLLIIFGYFSVVGLRIYSLCGMRAGVDSLGQVCRIINWKLQFIVDCAIVVMCLGTAISYLSLIGSLLPALLNSALNRSTALSLSILVLLPLSFIRNTKHLRYTSMLGLVGILFICFLSMYLLFKESSDISISFDRLFNPSMEGLRQLNVIVFVFTCHQNLLHIKADARDQSETFTRSVIYTCIGISGSIYLIFSFASYLTYGQGTESNILNNYSSSPSSTTSALMWISKFLFVLLAVFSFPLMVAPARSALSNLIMKARSDEKLSTILIVATSFGMSLFISDLSVISSWIGVLAGVPICFLLPGYLHFRYFNQDSSSDVKWKENSISSMIMFLVGIILIITFIVS